MTQSDAGEQERPWGGLEIHKKAGGPDGDLAGSPSPARRMAERTGLLPQAQGEKVPEGRALRLPLPSCCAHGPLPRVPPRLHAPACPPHCLVKGGPSPSALGATCPPPAPLRSARLLHVLGVLGQKHLLQIPGPALTSSPGNPPWHPAPAPRPHVE